MTKRQIDLRSCVLRMRDDGVVELRWKPIDEVTPRDIEEIEAGLRELAVDRVPMLVFSVGASMSFEAMEFASRGEAACAVAIVDDTRLGAVISKNIVEVIQALESRVPIAAFDNEADALAWLDQHRQ